MERWWEGAECCILRSATERRDDGWLNKEDRTRHVHTATWLGLMPRQDDDEV